MNKGKVNKSDRTIQKKTGRNKIKKATRETKACIETAKHYKKKLPYPQCLFSSCSLNTHNENWCKHMHINGLSSQQIMRLTEKQCKANIWNTLRNQATQEQKKRDQKRISKWITMKKNDFKFLIMALEWLKRFLHTYTWSRVLNVIYFS